ncbi:MAG: hypothetical protein NZO16_03240 [Deltaproteobacteria bacterium]|nr:hypothetical protein [Deltaproteobacteria bacterium]
MVADVSCLIIHPQLQVRQLLKAVFEIFSMSSNLESSLGGALEKIRSSEGFDLVCLSLRFDKKMIVSWLSAAKSTLKGRYSVYSALVSKEDRANPAFQQFVEKNFDCDFTENLTSDAFSAQKQRVLRLVSQRRECRLVDFFRMQINRILTSVDNLASSALNSRFEKSDPNWIYLESIQRSVLNSSPAVKSEYLEMIKNALKTKADGILDQTHGNHQNFNSKPINYLIKKV